ncbi:hypothetical protein H0N95_02925 [Candidatus Micrarchaeota archaeon]|nr:hypothetical protein [Candidatus Micrarchaeota archaeon]
MAVRPDSVLKILGYEIDGVGNIRPTRNQMAVITLEDTEDGGVLRIHGNASSFFYEAGEIGSEFFHPLKMSSKFVYFSDGSDNGFKVTKKEFTNGLMLAMSEYQKATTKHDLRG